LTDDNILDLEEHRSGHGGEESLSAQQPFCDMSLRYAVMSADYPDRIIEMLISQAQ
jgi:hypothetical protein